MELGDSRKMALAAAGDRWEDAHASARETVVLGRLIPSLGFCIPSRDKHHLADFTGPNSKVLITCNIHNNLSVRRSQNLRIHHHIPLAEAVKPAKSRPGIRSRSVPIRMNSEPEPPPTHTFEKTT